MKPVYKKSLNKLHFETYDEKPPVKNLQVLDQFHSNIITFPNKNMRADGILLKYSEFQKYTPCIKTADCLPIVLLGKESCVFLHAGWRALANNIFHQRIITDLVPTHAFIGPSIQAKSFEVQEDFLQSFPNSSSFTSINGRLFFNLQKEAQVQIENLFPKCKIETSKICTFESDSFHSYRKNKTEKRNWHILKLKKE